MRVRRQAGTVIPNTSRTRRSERTLLAYDGSASAQRALRRTATMHRAGDDLSVIHVSERGDDSDGHLAGASRLLAERGIEATLIPSQGRNPARAICVTAERDGFDTIVVGRRNLRDAGLLLLGSVAARVVSGAGCDVVVVA
jgi:nucleotide-binding universal stress UspA family protein